MFYVLSGALAGAGAEGDAFVGKVAARVSTFHPVSSLSSPAAIDLASVGPDDGVAFVIGDHPSAELTEFVRRAATAGAVVMPIALDTRHRRPPDVAGAAQSFDVVDALRRAGLMPEQLDWAARTFARAALARLAPTCFRERLRLFLCYRREDGEGLTAELDRKLTARHSHVFRDLVDIQVGDPAQEVIDRTLREADVVIFIDTPLTGESPWIARELATAMGIGLPVVWVRIGRPEGRLPLVVAPGEAPQVELVDAHARPIAEVTEDILEAALDQVQEAIRASMSAFSTVRRWADTHEATVSTLDQRRLIYAVTIPRDPGVGFPRRARRDIVQLFARNPDGEDIGELRVWLQEAGYTDHPVACRAFDAAVLIRPAAGATLEIDDWGVVDSGYGYVGELSGRRDGPEPESRPMLLLLGAFPAEPSSHPAVIAAVSALSRSWLASGGNLTFGSHPTFTPVIAEAARAVLGPGARDRIRAVRSDYFPLSPAEVGAGGVLTVHHVPASATLDESLMALRRDMIGVGKADVAVIVGGRTAEGGTHAPGVEDELRRARDARIPVVALASPGGQAAVMVERERRADTPWAGFGNGLPDQVNSLIADGDDYAETAHFLWERFGPPGDAGASGR